MNTNTDTDVTNPKLDNESTDENVVADAIPKKIEHLVISGGGTTIFPFYGALKEANQRNIWSISDIKTIYCTSAGSIISIWLSLNYEWHILDKFIINRPWHNVFKSSIYFLLESITEKGVYDKTVFEKMFIPLLHGKDLPSDLTMLGLYEYSGIEIHMFTIDLQRFEVVDVSHKTHPNWSVIDAAYASSCLPFLFRPQKVDDTYYVDGGLITNYPVEQCIQNGADPETIFGIYKTGKNNFLKLTDDSNIFDYFVIIMSKFLQKLNSINTTNKNSSDKIKYNINVIDQCTTLDILLNLTSSSEERTSAVDHGKNILIEYLLASCPSLDT